MPLRDDTGFSLIEVMLALSILSFGLLGIFSIHDYTIQNNSTSAHMTEAVHLAQQRMDFFGTLAFAPGNVNPLLQVTGGADPTQQGNPETMLVDLSTNVELVNRLGDTDPNHGPLMFRRSWRVDDAPGANSDRVVLLVRVTFRDKTNKLHGVTLAGARSWNGDGRF